VGLIDGLTPIGGPLYYDWRIPCSRGEIGLHFSMELHDVKDCFGPSGFNHVNLSEEKPSLLLRLTKQVRLVVKPARKGESQASAWFTSQEVVDLFEGEWPNEKSFTRVAIAIRERRRYPVPKAEIPGSGGKSMTAQGQTKKPGSHSHNKHH
jgi:hypothetical protein